MRDEMPQLPKFELKTAIWFGAAMMLLLVFWVVLICMACQPVKTIEEKFGLKEDNPLEEITEDALDKLFDVKIDLTGSSPE